MPKITRLRIQGFRAFGERACEVDISPELTVIWAPNSQGKTSVAEAIEFLLSGRITRKVLIGSAAREFTDSLRNAHISTAIPVEVSATVQGDDGSQHEVVRKLVTDYSARGDCVTELRIDGSVRDSLFDVGVQLSEPPLETPILLQHNLRFVLSAKPQERADYFKAILQITDLETFRDLVQNSLKALPAPESLILKQLREILKAANAEALLGGTGAAAAVIDTSLRTLLSATLGLPGNTPLDELVVKGRTTLEEKREAAFPLHALATRQEGPRDIEQSEFIAAITSYIPLRDSITATDAALLKLYESFVALPVELNNEREDCPLCLTPRGLSAERINAIRAELESTKDLRSKSLELPRLRSSVESQLKRLDAFVDQGLPLVITWSEQERRASKIDVAASSLVMATDAADVLERWQLAEQGLGRAREETRAKAEQCEQALNRCGFDNVTADDVRALDKAADGLNNAVQNLRVAVDEFQHASELLKARITPLLDENERLGSLRATLELAGRAPLLAEQLEAEREFIKVRDDLESSIKAIDEAKAKVLDEKFNDLASEISRWWEMLRGTEPSSFTGVQRAGSGRRFVDLKAGLRAEVTGAMEERDAVAVFSDSQLNCLGLAAFLARVSRENSGFVVLDDPIQGSDTEHRGSFLEYVPEALISGNQQVIILTHDERLSANIQERYSHRDIRAYAITCEDAVEGAQLEPVRDTIDEFLTRAQPLTRRADVFSRKSAAALLRQAAERFCKMVLVQDRRSRGEVANLYDYDGTLLKQLYPTTTPLLVKDPSHSGKLKTIEKLTNPGNHDDAAPSPDELRLVLGDLTKLRKDYLAT